MVVPVRCWRRLGSVYRCVDPLSNHIRDLRSYSGREIHESSEEAADSLFGYLLFEFLTDSRMNLVVEIEASEQILDVLSLLVETLEAVAQSEECSLDTDQVFRGLSTRFASFRNLVVYDYRQGLMRGELLKAAVERLGKLQQFLFRSPGYPDSASSSESFVCINRINLLPVFVENDCVDGAVVKVADCVVVDPYVAAVAIDTKWAAREDVSELYVQDRFGDVPLVKPLLGRAGGEVFEGWSLHFLHPPELRPMIAPG